MKNPCGKYSGVKSPINKSSGGKLGQVIGHKGTTKKFITG